jgi:hypothetical protein
MSRSVQSRLSQLSRVPASDGAAVRRVIVAGLLVTLVIAVLQAASQAINFQVYDLRVLAFNADKHYSVFGLVSLLAQAGVGGVSLLRASRARQHAWAWYLLGAIAIGLVIIRGLTSFNATVLAPPLAAVFVLLGWLTWGDGRVRLIVWGGLALLIVSLVLHKVGLAADDSLASDFTWGYQITGMVKHGAELVGWMLVATGVAAGMAAREASDAADGAALEPAHGAIIPARDFTGGELDRPVRL